MTEAIMKALDKLEGTLKTVADKADAEIAANGKTSTETKSAMEALGTQQRELADRLLQIEQKGASLPEQKEDVSIGGQLVKSASYGAFIAGSTQKLRIEVKNTLVGSDTNVAPDRKPGIIPGAFQPLTLEAFLNTVGTTSNAIEFTRELAFTNNAAETAEAAQKPESALTWSLVNMPISTVAHWIKISRQLAADAPALAAYVNTRMRYGVDRRVEGQLVSGSGVAPFLSGLLLAANYTAHGYTAAQLGATFPALVLIRKMIADGTNAGYAPDAILMNPSEWATLEISLLTVNGGQTPYSVSEGGQPRLFGLPVIQSVGMPLDMVAVGAFRQASTIYNREGTIVEMSDSDADNFTKNLITIRAERRLALVTEVPAAIRAGDLTPP